MPRRDAESITRFADPARDPHAWAGQQDCRRQTDDAMFSITRRGELVEAALTPGPSPIAMGEGSTPPLETLPSLAAAARVRGATG
jgi:hypothetical protein